MRSGFSRKIKIIAVTQQRSARRQIGKHNKNVNNNHNIKQTAYYGKSDSSSSSSSNANSCIKSNNKEKLTYITNENRRNNRINTRSSNDLTAINLLYFYFVDPYVRRGVRTHLEPELSWSKSIEEPQNRPLV